MTALLGSLLVAVVYVGGSSELLRQMMGQPSGQELGAHMVELARQSLGRPYRSFSANIKNDTLLLELALLRCGEEDMRRTATPFNPPDITSARSVLLSVESTV